MLVKMLVGIAGTFYTLAPGDEFHFPDDEATRLIKSGFAIPVVKQVVERAVLKRVSETRQDEVVRSEENVVSSNGNGRRRKRASDAG